VLHDIGAQVIADQVGVPFGGGHEPLHPIGGALPGVLSQLPTVLASDRTEQAAQVGQHPPAWLGAGKPTPDPGVQGLQPSRPGPYFLNLCCRLVGLRHGPSRLALLHCQPIRAGGREPTSRQLRLEY
jgi:hypothetical protein